MTRRRFWSIAKGFLIFLGVLAGLFGLIQLIPYGRTHSNPPTIVEPPWDSPRTRELAVRACFDCHSNHTNWPWYANVAPMSWMVQFDVEVGRDVLNFSEWNRYYERARYAGVRTLDGNMPLRKYIAAHPEADLTDAERQELADGLNRTLGTPNRSY